jgi:GNAT superfamily N-acetyltransferase
MSRFVFEPDPERFAGRVSGFLLSDSVLHTLPLTVLESVRAGRYAEWVLTYVESDDGDVQAVGVQTPPYNQIVAAADRDAVRELAHGLAARGTVLPGVTAMSPWVHDFAADWSALAGVDVQEDKAERLFRLDRLAPPRPAAGAARPATEADVELLTEWLQRFCEEVGIVEPLGGTDVTLRSVREGRRFVWQVEGATGAKGAGQVVCDVGHNIAVGGQVRIGPVYTPPEHRGRGYASNLTAHVTERILAAGSVPTLFTDLANPTSNGIYQAMGYRPVADAWMLRFAE